MNKTEYQIENDFYLALKGGELDNATTGKVYKNGTRPIDSDNEDIVIVFVSALSGQIEIGVININVYVKDLNDMKNTSRCGELEAILQSTVDTFPASEYDVSLREMIRTYKVEEKNEHFVNASVKFKRKSF